MEHENALPADIAAQITLLLYFELCVLILLGNWNDQPGMEKALSPGNMVFGGIIAAAQGVLLVGTVWRLESLLWLGLIGDSVWLILHGGSLWRPYIWGASPEYT